MNKSETDLVMLTAQTATKLQELLQILEQSRPVVVAFSAGVDSTVLAAAAFRACGSDAIAMLAVSPSLPAGTVAEARELASRIGIELRLLQTMEFDRAEYTSNPQDRCYFCKDTLYSTIAAIQTELADSTPVTICNGANMDDLGDHRPGMRAARDHAVRSPFIEAGLSKAEIRELARAWELPVWDKPASPCLASRIAYGIEVTPERVRRIDEAEAYLRSLLGLRELRVRLVADNTARIELPESAINEATSNRFRSSITARLKQLGFQFVTIDLEGFRSGSLNSVIPLSALESHVGQ